MRDFMAYIVSVPMTLLPPRYRTGESGIIPLLEKEGWMRDQENVAKQP
jgi:hypothetical protein